jgi:hypothetical protein
VGTEVVQQITHANGSTAELEGSSEIRWCDSWCFLLDHGL